MQQFRENGRVRITMEQNGVAQVRLIRDEKLNALDAQMFDTLVLAGKALFEKQGLRAVVLAGEGRGFCAGIDISSLGALSDVPLTERTYGNANIFQQVAMLWRKLPVPVIAAIHGVCFGGGLQIASGADIRVVAPDARLAIMEMKWGIIPDMGGYALWRGMVRDDVLRELTFTNREFKGEEAHALGFATCLDADPLSRATRIAHDIATRHPHAIRSAKALFNRAHDLSIDEILMAESLEQQRLIGTRNQMEAVHAQLQGRQADFTDP